MIKYLFIAISFLSLAQQLEAQPTFEQVDYLQVFKNDQSLKYPWGGGVNSSQFCDPDLNNDGIQDLVLYEKTEDRLLTFLSEGNGKYNIDRSYSRHFPVISGWIVMKDFNCDEVEDLFTYSNGSIKVYYGYYSSDSLMFRLISDGIFYPGFSGKVNLYSTFVDRPAIADFDNDGDLDILTFNVTFTRLNLYKNLRVERGLPCDTLAFKLDDNCWGNMMETGLSAEVDLRDTCSDKFPFPGRLDPYFESNLRRHAGSTLEAFDINGNGRLDVLMGDVSFSFVNYLSNYGTLENASILSQDTAYPRYDSPARVFSFPWTFFTDIDQDGRKDLLVTPFEGFGVDNIENVWYYKNSATDSAKLSLQTKSFMVGDMIDVGENAVPCLIDIDGDGLKDLLIGGGVRLGGGSLVYSIAHYQNIGFADYPVFRLVNENFLNFRTTGLQEPYPAVGDLDGDNLLDLVVGLGDGRILWYKNQSATRFEPLAPVLLKSSGNDLDVGQNAAPFIVDIDRDGRNDLIVGERNGNINYFRNTGSTGNPQFILATDSVGRIKTSTLTIPFGNSAPVVMDLDGDTKLDLIFGGYENIISWVSNISDSISSRVTPVPLFPGAPTPIGRKIAPVIADITNDGQWELLMGLQAGGLNFYSENPPAFRPVKTRDRQLTEALSFNIFPNPTKTNVQVRISNNPFKEDIFWEAIDITGRVAGFGNVSSPLFSIPTSSWPSGVYFIRISGASGVSGTQKLVKH